MARFLRRQVTYQLRPPAVLGAPAAPFVASAVRVALAVRANQSYLRRSVTQQLSPPAFVAPPIVFAPVSATLASRRAKQDIGRFYVDYRLRPPTALRFYARPLDATLAPVVRTRTRSTLAPPAVVSTPAAPFLPRPVDSTLASPVRTRTRSRLAPPAVVSAPAAPFLARPPQVKQAPQPRQGRGPIYRLYPPATLTPAVVSFVARPLQIRFTTTVKRGVEQRFYTSSLFPPELITPFDVTQFFAKKLARTPRQYRVTTSKLRAPVVLGAVVVVAPFRPIQASYSTAVQRLSQRRVTRRRLAAPTAVGTAFVTSPLQVVYRIATSRARRIPATGTQLQAPTVVSIAVSGDNPTGGVFDPNYFLLIHP